jgi:hypothetical protein
MFYAMMAYDTTPSHVALSFMQKWDATVQAVNEQAPMDASGAWHTSRLWIRAEAEKAIVDSTVATLLVSIGCGFLGTFCFTHFDMLLSAFVVASVGGVTACLAFFMCVMMSWPFGAVEVLGLIVFVGYSITYSLHIAHQYGMHTKATEGIGGLNTRRQKAVHHALEKMSSAVAGSALTTLGSSFFLFFCTMAIFVKLASVLFAVTFFACLFALVALPSALLVAGPIGFCGCGAVRSWMRGERVDYDATEASVLDPDGLHVGSTPGAPSGSSVADVRGTGGFDGRRGSGSPMSADGGAISFGDLTQPAIGEAKSEVFISTPMITPASSPGIRPLMAHSAGAPGPPIMASGGAGPRFLQDLPVARHSEIPRPPAMTSQSTGFSHRGSVRAE